MILNAFACCLRRLDGSTWPLRVCAGHTKPSSGFPAASQRDPSTARTRGVIGITLRAAAVLPCVTSIAPLRPLSHVTFSQHKRKHSSGRVPVSASTVAIDASGSGAAARYRASSSGVITRSRRRSPGSTLILGAVLNAAQSTARLRRNLPVHATIKHRRYWHHCRSQGSIVPLSSF